MIFNGDTFFDIDIRKLGETHEESSSECTLAAPYIDNADRYGTLTTNTMGRIKDFAEKKPGSQGYINGGIYALKKTALSDFSVGTSFSFEEDYLTKYVDSHYFQCVKSERNYFIDIGIPDDYQKFKDDQHDLGSTRT